MSNVYTGPVDLPQYIRNGDFTNQEIYFELMSLLLTQWFSSSGFQQPPLTNNQVAALLALPQPPLIGTHWYNSDIDAMQFVGVSGVQTVTSTY